METRASSHNAGLPPGSRFRHEQEALGRHQEKKVGHFLGRYRLNGGGRRDGNGEGGGGGRAAMAEGPGGGDAYGGGSGAARKVTVVAKCLAQKNNVPSGKSLVSRDFLRVLICEAFSWKIVYCGTPW